MSGQKTLYSQGFNFTSFIEKGVDPRTGQYTCAIDIYETAPQIKNCPSLKLSLSFNALNTENIGFGRGWSFNLPSYEHRQGRATLSLSTGESFRTTETSSNLSVTDQKLQVSKVKKLQSGQYQIAYKSAQVEILSNANDTYNKAVLVELYSHIGRSLSFKWITSGEQPRLERILQGNDVLLQVKYETSRAIITRAPGTSEACAFTLIQRNDELKEIQLPLSGVPAWKFTYDTFGKARYLQYIVSPSGLVEQVQYKEHGHRLPTRAPFQSIPYVISHTAQPGLGQPPVVTRYAYSDHNFLGYGGSRDWNDGRDNLYLVPYDYQYSSTVRIAGGTTTRHTYNKFHLLIMSEQQKGRKRIIQATTYHARPSTGFEAQPAQYQLPKTVETIYEDTASSTSRRETTHHFFDEWGNPTEDIARNGVKTSRTYYPPAGEKGSGSSVLCPPDPHGFQRYIKTETVTPADSAHWAPTRTETYTYGQMPTATGGKVPYFVAVKTRQALEGSKVLTTTDYKYVNQPSTRDHGRFQQEDTLLNGKFLTTKKWTHTYPNNYQLKEATATKSYDDSISGRETIYSLLTGLALCNKDEAGVSENLDYDSIGRLTKLTVAPGTPYETVVRHDYSILGAGNGTQKTVTDAKGLETRYISDGLDRLCRVEQQDIDKSTFRVIQERGYNAQGRQNMEREIDWMRNEGGKEPTKQANTKTMDFDDWGKISRVTESSGLVTLSAMDPITLRKSEGIEGEGTVRTQLNHFGAPTQIALHRSDKARTLYSEMTYSYDGLGRLVSQQDHLGHTTTYRYDSFDRIDETHWPGSRVVTTDYAKHVTAALPTSMKLGTTNVGEQELDGLGRLRKRIVGGRTTEQSYKGNSPEPHEIISSKGDKLNLDYVPALNYAPTRLATSSHDDHYEYDLQSGTLSQAKGSYSTHDLEYQPSGLLSRETIKIHGRQTLSTSYTHSMAGKLQEYTDVHGTKLQVTYDEFGRPQTLSQAKLKVSFAYDNASRVSEIEVKDEKQNTKLVSKITYDEFGREMKRSVTIGDQTPLYDLTLTYSELGQITKRLQEKGGVIMREETFEYDARRRLVKYGCRGSNPPVDEGMRPLKSQAFTFDNLDNIVECSTEFHDGSSNTAKYSFSAQKPTQITKITNSHPEFSSQVEIKYDANGNLTQDEQGQTLEYDGMNRLTAVRDTTNQIVTQYRYDAAGKMVCQQVPGLPDVILFYRGDSLIAVQGGDAKISYLCNGSKHWGETRWTDGEDEGFDRTTLWALDSQNSVLATLDTSRPEDPHYQQYSPYCFSPSEVLTSSIGFNGQWRDPVTKWYHLGNGYRVYNPVLMRFHTPDPWSPFTSGEINPYVYCLGDPVNRVDPSGHLSIFGFEFGWKDLIMAIIGIAVSIGVGILTGGAYIATQVVGGILAGAASDVFSGMIGDAVDGNPITWETVRLDLAYSMIGGVAGFLGGSALKRGLSSVKKSAVKALGGTAAKATMDGATKTLKETVASSVRGTAREFLPSQAAVRTFDRLLKGWDGVNGNTEAAASAEVGNSSVDKPLGSHGPAQVGLPDFYLARAAARARNTVRPVLKDGDLVPVGGTMSTWDSGTVSSYGGGTRTAESLVSQLLHHDTRVPFVFSTKEESE